MPRLLLLFSAACLLLAGCDLFGGEPGDDAPPTIDRVRLLVNETGTGDSFQDVEARRVADGRFVTDDTLVVSAGASYAVDLRLLDGDENVSDYVVDDSGRIWLRYALTGGIEGLRFEQQAYPFLAPLIRVYRFHDRAPHALRPATSTSPIPPSGFALVVEQAEPDTGHVRFVLERYVSRAAFEALEAPERAHFDARFPARIVPAAEAEE